MTSSFMRRMDDEIVRRQSDDVVVHNRREREGEPTLALPWWDGRFEKTGGRSLPRPPSVEAQARFWGFAAGVFGAGFAFALEAGAGFCCGTTSATFCVPFGVSSVM